MTRTAWSGVACRAVQTQTPLVLVTQCSVEGSAPREVGAKMLVFADHTFGSIGGGRLEHQLIEQARSMMAKSDAHVLLQDYPLGPMLAQCCGGHVRILLEKLTIHDANWLFELGSFTNRTAWTKSDLRGEHGPRRIVLSDSPVGVALSFFSGLNDVSIDGMRPNRRDCSFFYEPIAPPYPTICLYGAGHVGQALAHILSKSDFAIIWFDNRPEFDLQTDPVKVTPFDDVDALIDGLPPHAMHLVFTHSHDLDYQLCSAILTKANASFCGLIGSKTKRARFKRRLREDGLDENLIEALTCPIGMSAIPQKTPMAIAVSVAADLYVRADEWAARLNMGIDNKTTLLKLGEPAQ